MKIYLLFSLEFILLATISIFMAIITEDNVFVLSTYFDAVAILMVIGFASPIEPKEKDDA